MVKLNKIYIYLPLITILIKILDDEDNPFNAPRKSFDKVRNTYFHNDNELTDIIPILKPIEIKLPKPQPVKPFVLGTSNPQQYEFPEYKPPEPAKPLAFTPAPIPLILIPSIEDSFPHPYYGERLGPEYFNPLYYGGRKILHLTPMIERELIDWNQF